jgi:hypothetical protein
MVALGLHPCAKTWNSVIKGYASVDDREKAMKRMKDAGVDPDVDTWNAVIAGYSKDEAKEALERMKATGVQPNLVTVTTIMGRCKSFLDRRDVFFEMTSGSHAVQPSKEMLTTLFSSPGVRDHLQNVTGIVRAHKVLLCDHKVLGKLLPLYAEANDTQLLHELWEIGKAGLSDWPGVQGTLTAYLEISKVVPEHRPPGGGWALLSTLLGLPSTPRDVVNPAVCVVSSSGAGEAAHMGDAVSSIDEAASTISCSRALPPSPFRLIVTKDAYVTDRGSLLCFVSVEEGQLYTRAIIRNRAGATAVVKSMKDDTNKKTENAVKSTLVVSIILVRSTLDESMLKQGTELFSVIADNGEQ